MAIISNDEPRLAESLSSAEALFWGAIAAEYPEATSGDLSPNESIKLSTAMRSAVTEWLMFNADPPPPEAKTVEVMLHRVEYYYRDYPFMRITDGDVEHIAYCISQGISEGELCTTRVTQPDEEIYGYWKINNNPE